MKNFKHLKFIEKHGYLILDTREPYRLDMLTYAEKEYLARRYAGKCNLVICQEGNTYIHVA